MKVLLIFCLMVNANVFAQDQVYDYPDVNAKFPGGSTALQKFISENLIHPQVAIDSGYAGMCYVSFLICEDGTCQNFRIARGVMDCPECDQEIIRIMKLMPKWNPAIQDEKRVAMNFHLPVAFDNYFCNAPDQPAEFPGGLASMNHWISEFMRYPQDAIEYSLQGKCYVELIVGANGVCRDVKLLRGVRDCPSCDEEALRLVKSMPKWNPATKDCKPIEVSTHVAITFRLN